MKKMRRLIPAIAMLLVSAVMLSTASFAWFTMGTTATAEGMKVTAQAASSLLIIKGVADDAAFNDFASANNIVTYSEDADTLEPATAYDANNEAMAGDVTSMPASGLVTISNPEKVNSASGVAMADAEYEAAGTANYKDYVVFIASGTTSAATGDTGETLHATVTLPDAMYNDNGQIVYINNALTIQFYVWNEGKGTDGTIGTATASPKITLKDVATADEKTLDVNLGAASVPSAFTADSNGEFTSLGNYVKVIMRVYYDGAMTDGNQCYIRNEMSVEADAAFNVDFAFKTPAAGN